MKTQYFFNNFISTIVQANFIENIENLFSYQLFSSEEIYGSSMIAVVPVKEHFYSAQSNMYRILSKKRTVGQIKFLEKRTTNYRTFRISTLPISIGNPHICPRVCLFEQLTPIETKNTIVVELHLENREPNIKT